MLDELLTPPNREHREAERELDAARVWVEHARLAMGADLNAHYDRIVADKLTAAGFQLKDGA